MEKIGLIAGNRKFPILFAQAAKKQGFFVVALAIKGETSRELLRFADKVYWIGLSEFRKIFDYFKSEGVFKIIMAGQISPYRLFSREVVDNPEIKRLLGKIRDKKAATIFSSIAKELEDAGFQVLDSTTFICEHIPNKGTLTKREPSFDEWEDIYFGLTLARQVAYLDIGQAVAVKNKAIVAVEALEGTDNLIKRAGRLAGKGIAVIKVSRPNQDMRFDIPVIGFNTIKTLIAAKAQCLAIEADKTLFIDREASVALADKKGVSIVVV